MNDKLTFILATIILCVSIWGIVSSLSDFIRDIKIGLVSLLWLYVVAIVVFSTLLFMSLYYMIGL